MFAIAGAAPAPAEAGAAWPQWTTTLHAASPVIGLYAATAKGPVPATPEDLIAGLAQADYVLLGEVHDNPDHHFLQAWIIGQLAAKGRKPVAVFEMIDAGQEAPLRAWLAKGETTAEGLGAALDWEKRGWPAWAMYKPVAEAALKAATPGAPAILSAGGPDRETVGAVSRGGLDAKLSRDEQERLGLAKDLPEALTNDLKEELFEDHCRLMPREATGPLVKIQRLRDASFADRMLKAGAERRQAGGTVVLIAGGGHVRKDRGVPYYVLSREPGAKLAAVIFAEANGEARSPDQIGPLEPGASAKADFVWITPAAQREDQCEQLRKRLEKKKEQADKPR